jgi:hypothetical protein
MCFRTTKGTKLFWTLPEPVSGADLVLRALAEARRQTPVITSVTTSSGADYDRANVDEHTWGPHRPGTLDTVDEDTVSTAKYAGFAIDVRICVSSLAVTQVVPAP